MNKLSYVVTSAAACAALAFATFAYAQPLGGMGPGMGMGHGMGPGMGTGPGHGPMGGFDAGAVADARLTYMKAQLKITPAQETAWQAFATASKQQSASMQSLRERMWDSAGSAPDHMALRAEAMQQRAAAMAAVSNAFGALYAVLTSEQKAIADQGYGMAGHRGMPFARRAG